MGKYKELEEFSEKQFRRLTDVKRGTFEKMVAVLLETQQNGKKQDFKLFKESKVRWTKERSGLTDSG